MSPKDVDKERAQQLDELSADIYRISNELDQQRSAKTVLALLEDQASAASALLKVIRSISLGIQDRTGGS